MRVAISQGAAASVSRFARRTLCDGIGIWVCLVALALPAAAQWRTGYFWQGDVQSVAAVPWSNYTHVIHYALRPTFSNGVCGLNTTQGLLRSADIEEFVNHAHAAGVKAIIGIRQDDALEAIATCTAPDNVAQFVERIRAFVATTGYDGVDLHWETNTIPSQYQDLVRRLRTALPTAILSVLVGLGERSMTAAVQYDLDQINIRADDLDSPYHAMDILSREYVYAGNASFKLGLAVPFYSRIRKGCLNDNGTNAVTDQDQPWVGRTELGLILYRDLVNSPYWSLGTRVWDELRQSQYIRYIGGTCLTDAFIPYSGPEQMQAAVAQMRANGFGGIATFGLPFEYMRDQAGDSRYPLSTAIYRAITGSDTPRPKVGTVTTTAQLDRSTDHSSKTNSIPIKPGSLSGASFPATLKTGMAPSFRYSGAPLVSVLPAARPSVPLSRDFFGQTILNLIRRWSGPATAFPSFPVSTFRFWDVVNWRMLEQSGPQPSWARMDQTLALAQRNGVKDFIFTFGRVPQWASTNSADPCTAGGGEPGSCDPPQMNAFDAFATSIVQRYCGHIKYYETWNEPNNTGYWNGTKAQLLNVAKHVYKIAKDPANCGCTNGVCSPNGGVNPNQVLMPSVSRLSQYNLSWLNSYLAEAGPDYPYADIASFHGYGATNPEEIADQVQQFRQTVAVHGLATLPLWNTEASWGEETSEVGEGQASWLMRYHMVQATIGISRVVWYAYDNCNWGTLWSVSPCGNNQATKTLTLPGTAYAVIESWLTGANLSGCNHYKDGLWACELTRPGGYYAWMLWSAARTSISVPASDYLGLTVYRDWQNDVNSLPRSLVVDQMPVLLETHDLAQH